MTVLFLGSGGQKIGQAGEFDYAGYQAIRAFSARKIKTILVNPNMTAVQTSEGIADATYFLPVTPEFVTGVIEKEKPDSLVICLGGKTAYYCALELERTGILEKYNIQILGTPIETMKTTLCRETFIGTMQESRIPVPESVTVTTPEGALAVTAKTGYPVMVRTDATLNDNAPAVCRNDSELLSFFSDRTEMSDRVTIEEWLGGWKEIELEVLRDAMDNCIVVCSMENLDPVGIHTGDSPIVIPAQTLTDSELQELRRAAFAAVRALNVIGEANIRFAKDPDSAAFRIIEANTSFSRSTALASRASGYQLGHIAAYVALGFSLSEIEHLPAGCGHVCCEPVFDYLMVKVPRWDPWKFAPEDRQLGSVMKSVGQAMAVGKTFCEALQKALRMTGNDIPGLAGHPFTFKDIKEALRNPDHLRLFAVYSALADGWSVDRIYKYTKIDRLYLTTLKEILDIETNLRSLDGPVPADLMRKAKQAGYSDRQIGLCSSLREEQVRALRKELLVRPVVKQLDSRAGMGKNTSNVVYMTYNGATDDTAPLEKGILLPGSGPYHIGSSVEYDWCTVSAAKSLKKSGKIAILVNCNPESLSSDPETADRVYVEEISQERILDIMEAEKPEGIMLSYGGSLTSALALPLSRKGIAVFGTAAENVERVNDRNKFVTLLDGLDIKHPDWVEAPDFETASAAAHRLGYPVFIEPKARGRGVSAAIAWDAASLKKTLNGIYHLTDDHAVTLSPYVENSKEIEIDAVADRGEILVYAIGEHIENAGIHSGDATVVLPAQRIYLTTARAVKKTAGTIARELMITGPFSIRFLAKSTNLQVIDCSIRAGRTMPFCSRVFRTNFVDIAVRAQLALEPEKLDGSTMDIDYVGVRAAQFSYARLKGTDPVAGVEMTSTGEVGCLGRGVRDAFLKALLSTGLTIPEKKILLSTGPLENKVDFVESARKLRAMGYTLAASGGTARFLQNNGIPAEALAWPLENKTPNIADALRNGEIDLVINIPKNNRETELKNDYSVRRLAIDYGIPLITNIKLAKQFTDSLEWYKSRGLELKSREEYFR